MHNNIMAAGSKERPPMLGPGRYSQWHSRFLRYLDTKSNGEYLRKCIFDGPYMPTNVLIAAVEAAENILPVAAHEEVETIHNMTAENKLYFQAEKEAIFLILTGIGDEIYSTVDACNTSKEMWTAIERLQQGESLNVQDVKTNLFWEFGKFTSRDGESMESYYSRFYKLMNELTRNNLQVSPMQVNVQFLQQLQPEWSRFVTVVKQSQEIDTVSYHKLFDVLKQFQNEVNDIRSERLARRRLTAEQVLLIRIDSTKTMMKNDVFDNVRRHLSNLNTINDTYVVVVWKRDRLLINARFNSDNEENKTFLKQLKKANASLTQELKECKTNLDESSRALGEATSSRDSSLIALQTKQTEREKDTP
ncbi:hypothetical protein Tco_0393501 [Tanacetum coccineum]